MTKQTVTIRPEALLQSWDEDVAELREHIAMVESVAQEFTKKARRATELATGLEAAAEAEPRWRSYAENLRQTAQQLQGFEQTIRTQVQGLKRPLQIPSKRSYQPE